MSSEQVNGLAKSASAYLRSAMHQPVDWQEWGPEAFAKAQSEDKPILLDIGAVWCHWCHVMDRESYEDPLTARIINDHYIAVKVDRDERPDVDTRYQAAVASISGQGGWPLTAFLTPQGLPYFGGTYFPPKDQHGRPSMQRVLLTMAEAFQKRRGEVDESAESVMAAIEENETFNESAPNPGAELHAKLIAATLKQFDARNGGFGGQPKFPHPGAIDMLLDAASRTGAIAGAKEAALVTLEKMAKGGVYDHLAGGFHRYSVDERWVVPHFEKMAYDNSELLKNYVHAYQSFGATECARVAFETMQWMDEWLSDQELGGFYASQDADFSLEDDGDYFTWTRAEAAAVLSSEELAIAAPWFDIGELGDMHHNPQKNVLHILQPLAMVAKSARVGETEAEATLKAAKRKLYAARLSRPTPFIDKTVYTAWNGMCISAYLEASRVLRMPEARAFALKSLDRVLDSAWSSDGSMAHVVAYGDGASRVSRVAGGLEDYVFMGHAALDAWEATGEMKYYAAAEEIAASTVSRFFDAQGNGFFDTESLPEGEKRLGALGTRRKPLQDSPTPAGNPVAVSLLLRVAALNGREDYFEKAKLTLDNFAGMVEHLGLYAAGYALALQRMIQPVVQICVVGDDALAGELEGVALARFVVNKTVIKLRRDQLGSLPPALAEPIPNLPSLGSSFALVCTGRSCLPPVSDAEGLIAALAAAI
jgi:uncharacterized protein YyaL (SSP411 family)